MHQSYQHAIGVFDFNLKRHQYARGSRSAPYPQARDVYVWSSLANPEDDFSDLYMNDLVHVGKHVVHKKLRTLETTKFLTALLMSLGTRTQIPTRHMLDTLGVQTTSDSNVPSGYRLGTF